jgi:hypothetical protein
MSLAAAGRSHCGMAGGMITNCLSNPSRKAGVESLAHPGSNLASQGFTAPVSFCAQHFPLQSKQVVAWFLRCDVVAVAVSW